MNLRKTLLISAITASISTYSLAGSDQGSEVENKLKAAWLDGKVEMALLLDRNLNNFEIDTSVVGTKAFLTGSVDNELDQRLAGEIAESVDGITEVENSLVVESTTNETSINEELIDVRVKSVLAMKLMLEGEIRSKNISIESKGGVVTLAGSVPSQAQADLAIAIATNTSGVEKVISKMEVES